MKFIFANDEQTFAIQFSRKEFGLDQKLMTHIIFSPKSIEAGIRVIERLERCRQEDVKPKPHLKLV